VDGIVISGDVAFGGKVDEYEYAHGWIESTRELIECPLNGVMVTPGNHDIDHAIVPADGAVDLLHEEIRKAANTQQCNERLATSLRDPDKGEALFSPLAAYNEFASKYGCRVHRESPYWERDFRLRDGTIIRFRGITTTLLSSARDNYNSHRMLYGGAQLSILREPNVRHAIVGHHPPSWTIDSDDADHVLASLTCLQIFGHKHEAEHWLVSVGHSVRIIAGAVHPSRNESTWQPRYSAFAISAIDDRNLALRIFPRRWSGEELMFIGDFNSQGHDYRDYTLQVPPRQS